MGIGGKRLVGDAREIKFNKDMLPYNFILLSSYWYISLVPNSSSSII